nr:ADP-ribosylation factor-like protein 2 [Tanacetum cinerariifolium]
DSIGLPRPAWPVGIAPKDTVEWAVWKKGLEILIDLIEIETLIIRSIHLMGLLSIIRKIKRKEKEMRILMVGLDNSGKTTIVLKINGEDTSVISPTIGFNIKTMTYDKYTLNIWDVGGQKTIRSYWRNYFEQTDGLVWVVDSSDLRRLDDCKYELDNLLKEERLSGASLLVFANKQDIQGALSPDEIAKVLNLDAMDKTRHWRIVGCSAYTGDGLLEGFDWLVQDIASRIYVLD